MKILTASLLLAFTCLLPAEVVRPAPEFTWQSFNGNSKTLSSLTKQPVVLIIAPSPTAKIFKKQLKEIERLYRQYAGREALFVAAFTQEPGIVRSNIPFLYASDPQALAMSYGLDKENFKLAIVGPDKNLDLITNEMTSGERVRDVIDNSFTRQSVRRK